jgi:hypothetical protein
MNIKVNKTFGKASLVSNIILKQLGSKSVKLTHIITPAAKESDIVIILLFLRLSKNITKEPIMVDIPAKKDKIKAYKVLFGINIPPSKLYALK